MKNKHSLVKKRGRLYKMLFAQIHNQNSKLAKNITKRIWAIESKLDISEAKRISL